MTTDLASTPLSGDEIMELDRLLLALPEERNALDVVMLDGYLAGVLLQPGRVSTPEWLPLVFDASGAGLGGAGNGGGNDRMVALVMRRHDELAACIAAREPFEPIVFELDGEDGQPLAERLFFLDDFVRIARRPHSHQFLRGMKLASQDRQHIHPRHRFAL